MAAWLYARPHPAHQADASMWLDGRGVRGQIAGALGPVLMELWRAAWEAGAKGAGELTGKAPHIPAQVAADRIGRMSARWLAEVTDTRMRRIAEILAAGGTAAALEVAIRAALASEPDADLIARTETTRAMAEAAGEAYRAAGVERVRWITRSDHPCPACLANEAAGPRYLGEAFPSGSTAPPEHPHCECALVPAEGE